MTCLIAPHQRAVLVRNPVAQSDFALGLRCSTQTLSARMMGMGNDWWVERTHSAESTSPRRSSTPILSNTAWRGRIELAEGTRTPCAHLVLRSSHLGLAGRSERGLHR